MSAPKALTNTFDIDRDDISHKHGRLFRIDGLTQPATDEYETDLDGDTYRIDVREDLSEEDGIVVAVYAPYY